MEIFRDYWFYFVLLGFACIFFIPVKLKLHLFREPNRVLLSIRITLWFIPININFVNPVTPTFWRLSRNKPWREKPPADIQAHQVKWKRIFYRLDKLKKISQQIWAGTMRLLRKIGSRIKITELNLYTEIGLADAAQTALSIGVVWSFFALLYGRLAGLFNMNEAKNNIRVVPNYQSENLVIIDYSCIFAFRLGHIIIIIYQTLRGVGEIFTLVRRISR